MSERDRQAIKEITDRIAVNLQKDPDPERLNLLLGDVLCMVGGIACDLNRIADALDAISGQQGVIRTKAMPGL